MSTNDQLSLDRDDAASKDKTLGRELLIVMVRALRTVAVHEMANEAVGAVIKELEEVVSRQLSELDSLELQAVGINVYFRHQLITPRGPAYEASMRLREIYKRLGINEISIRGPFDASALTDFLLAFQRYYRSSTPKDILKHSFRGLIVRIITETEELEVNPRLNLARTYSMLVVKMQEVCEMMKAGKPPMVPALRKAVQRLIDAAQGLDSVLVGLTRFDDAHGDLGFHAAAVGSFAILMGQRLQLSRTELVRLVLAALMHDLGRVNVNDTNPLQHDLAMLDRVSGVGSALLIGRWTTTLDALDRACAALDRGAPLKGSPARLAPGMAARLISVPCAFDLLTRPPPPRRPRPPDHALRDLLAKGGEIFDPRAVRLFGATIGLFPVGTMVRLSGGQLAVVMEVAAETTRFARPIVKVIEGPGGYIVDLADPAAGLSIVEVVDARSQTTNPTFMLLA
ncbi:MAG: hypothetical protein U1E65_06875 [Myxococcota bacterium]